MNLDRILPFFAPLLRRVLRSTQKRREAHFEAVPAASGRLVFLGDSITEMTDWGDWFPELRTMNRGIGGQAICDLLPRLHTALIEPKAVSLMIGTNDLHGLGKSSKVEDIADQMRVLVQKIQSMAPSATLLVNSITPRSAHFRDRIVALNQLYRQIAEESGSLYVDLWPTFAGPDGVIHSELTTEGLHLSVAGYKAWTDVLRPYLFEFAE
jgi:lysophospholipase L1-like esterase